MAERGIERGYRILMTERQIFRTIFGSRLYGTSTPASDLDYKSVFTPDAKSILLQRAKGAVNSQRPKGEHEKNVAGEVEEERFSIQRYLGLLAEGQTVALDMLFAPAWAWTDDPSWEWHEIVENKERLLTRKTAAFIGYSRKQAAKYGIKGSRVASSRSALEALNWAIDEYGANEKLAVILGTIETIANKDEHMALVDQTMPNGGIVRHWEVCGRKLPYTASIKNARDIMQKLVDEYGHRALQAESNQGVDWKALSHAVRVGYQAIDLLNTGEVVFPLSYAPYLIEIKTGQRDYKSVAEEIEWLVAQVECAAAKSSLRDEPDYEWIDHFVASIHRDQALQYR